MKEDAHSLPLRNTTRWRSLMKTTHGLVIGTLGVFLVACGIGCGGGGGVANPGSGGNTGTAWTPTLTAFNKPFPPDLPREADVPAGTPSSPTTTDAPRL